MKLKLKTSLAFGLLASSMIFLSCTEKKTISDFQIKINSPHLPFQLYQIEEERFKSKTLGTNQEILIFKPKTINSSDSVEILYLLDGEYSTDRLQMLRMRFKDFDSEFIAVGITNSSSKSADLFTTNAAKYLLFLTDEVIPKVEKDYTRISRILFGHSNAGAFTFYTLLNKPSYFSEYYAINPSPFIQFTEDLNEIDTLSLKKVVLHLNIKMIDSAKVQNEFSQLNNFLVEKSNIILRPKLEFFKETSFLDEVIKLK